MPQAVHFVAICRGMRGLFIRVQGQTLRLSRQRYGIHLVAVRIAPIGNEVTIVAQARRALAGAAIGQRSSVKRGDLIAVCRADGCHRAIAEACRIAVTLRALPRTPAIAS
jgi:hypothetical protein